MAREGFDYGTPEDIIEPGSDYKQPSVGDHAARLRSIIHAGMYREEYNGKLKKPFPEVIAIFELKEDDDFEEDGVTPLTISKSFPLKKGDRAFMTKFLSALDPQGTATGFGDLIGNACTVSCKASKDKNEDGSPKYVNFGGLSGLPAKFAAMLEPLAVEGVGHVPFNQLTKAAILELNPILEVNKILMHSENYSGSKAEEIINEIRKENPDFAERKKKDETEGAKEKPAEKESNLDEEEEF